MASGAYLAPDSVVGLVVRPGPPPSSSSSSSRRSRLDVVWCCEHHGSGRCRGLSLSGREQSAQKKGYNYLLLNDFPAVGGWRMVVRKREEEPGTRCERGRSLKSVT